MDLNNTLDLHFMYHIYRKINSKSKSISILQRLKRLKTAPMVNQEIIWVYVYFNDIERAYQTYQDISVSKSYLFKSKILLDCKVGNPDMDLIISTLKINFDSDLFELYCRLSSLICNCNPICKPTNLTAQCKVCMIRNMQKLYFLKMPEYAGSITFDNCISILSNVNFENIKRLKIMRNPFVPNGEILEHLHKNKEDYELLSYVASRRYCPFLVKDKRLAKITNESVEAKALEQTNSKTVCSIKLRNIKNIKCAHRKYKKYFRLIKP